MVFFSCNSCGQSVKKNQVEKHYQFQCRNCEVLSCVDCGKDFRGDEYKSHIKCISEDEKYGNKSETVKTSINKGEAKQDQWIENIKRKIATASVRPVLANLLEKLLDFPNIPRKKGKFEKFLQNSLKMFDAKLISEIWDIVNVLPDKKTSRDQQLSQKRPIEDDVEADKNGRILENKNAAVEHGITEKKKRKKHKHSIEEDVDVEKNNVISENKDASGFEIGSDEKKKHKKKRKNKDRDVASEETGVQEVTSVQVDDICHKKKKKKHKKHERLEETIEFDEENQTKHNGRELIEENGAGSLTHETNGEDESPKKKKKKKKTFND